MKSNLIISIIYFQLAFIKEESVITAAQRKGLDAIALAAEHMVWDFSQQVKLLLFQVIRKSNSFYCSFDLSRVLMTHLVNTDIIVFVRTYIQQNN